MRKNINKIVALAIGISVLNGSIISAFAADNTQSNYTTTNIQKQDNIKSVLTLDDAIKSAISISDTLQLDTLKITYQDTTNDINEDLDDFNNVSGDDEDFNNDTRDINSDQKKQQKEFDQDILTQKVTKAYDGIVTKQMSIDKAGKLLEIKKSDLDNAKFKNSLGIKTSLDIKSAELEIQNLENQLNASKNALEDSEYSFKVLTGKDLAQYGLEEDVNLELFKIDGDVDEYLDNVIDNYLNYTEQLVKLDKDYYYDSNYSGKVTASDLSNAQTTSAAATIPEQVEGETFQDYMEKYNAYESQLSAYTTAVSKRLTYLQNKLSVSQNQTTLNDNKKTFKDQLKTIYTNIRTSEDNINYIKKNIELNNETLSNTKLKSDLGMITKSDYNTEVVNSEELNIELRNEIINYNTLKEEIQKPWIAFSNS